MPRTVPAAIAAKTGNRTLRFVWLMEWQLPAPSGTKYYSSGQQVTYSGHVYEKNRVRSIGGLTAQFIDRKHRDFGRLSLTLDNLADDQSLNFPITALDAAQVLEDALIKIHLYDLDDGVAVDSVWFGYSGRPKFDAEDTTVEMTASFLWDSRELVVPAKSLQLAGFGTLATNRQKESLSEEDDAVVPLLYGVANFKLRPVIYAARTGDDGYFHVNFIVSGTAAGLPFQAGDLTVGNCKFKGKTQASVIDFTHVGNSVDTVPDNLTRFPDGVAHNLVAYAYCAFAITDDIKNDLDNVDSGDIKIQIANGRPLIDTGVVSENPVLILKDILRDPNYGLGLSNGAFDAAVVSASATYAASKWQSRLELRERMPLIDLCQRLLTDFHGFLTFNGGLIQIGVKTNAEVSRATFATADSGSAGRTIHSDIVIVSELDSSELINSARLSYRQKNRQVREMVMYDPTAQGRAGGTIKRVVEEEFELISIYDETQAQINGANILREEQNGDLFIEFSTPLVEGLDVAPGDIITVKSPDIFNNVSNFLFRIHSQTFDTGEEPLSHFRCQVYKPALYNYDTSGIGVDILRGGVDTSGAGRPPDVTPVSLQVVDTQTNDTEGKQTTLRATWTYPVVDLAGLAADGIFSSYPIAALQLWAHYTDESIHSARLVSEVKYPTATADFLVDHHKNRSVECFFVALANNRARDQLGYIADLTKVTSLTAILSATAATANVVATGSFTVNDYCLIENEIAKLLSKTSNQLTFVTSGGNRAAQFDTVAIAHALGVQIAVAKLSYPSLIVSLTPPRFTYPIVTGFAARQRVDGVRFHWNDPNATNQERFYLYWSIDADALSNAAKLGSANPAWFATDPNSPPAGVFLIKVDDLSHKILQELIGVAGTNVMARVAARNGKHNFSSALSASAQSRLGDDGIPVLTLQPRVVIKKIGVRVVGRMPTTNMKTFSTAGKVEIVFKALNGGGSILGYLVESGGAWASSGVEARFDNELVSHHTFNVSKDDVLAIWPTVATLKVYIYVTNGVGTSAASPESTINVATWEVIDANSDTAAPGPLATPTLKAKPGKLALIANIDISATLNQQTVKDRWELAIHNGVDSLNIGDPSSEAKVAGIVFYPVNIPRALVHADRDHLLRIFGSSASLRSRYRVTNNIGSNTSVDSSPLSLSGLKDVTTLYNPNNLIRNGHFTYHNGSQAKRWEEYDPRSGVFSPLVTTGKLRFDLEPHRGKWRDTPTVDNQRFLTQNLGQTFFRSEAYSLIWNMYANGTPTIDEIVVGLFTQKTLTNNISGTSGLNTVSGSGFITDGVKIGTVIGENSIGQWRTVIGVSASQLTVDRVWGSSFGPTPGVALIPQSTRLSQTNLALTTADKFQKGLVLTDSDLDTALDVRFVVILRDIVDTVTFPFIDAICLNAGEESAGYQRSVDSYETNFAGSSENFNTPPTQGSGSGGSQQPGSGSGAPGEVLPILL